MESIVVDGLLEDVTGNGNELVGACIMVVDGLLEGVAGNGIEIVGACGVCEGKFGGAGEVTVGPI